MAKPNRVAIEEADIQKVIPGAKAYWNANGTPHEYAGCCRSDFFGIDGRRYMCEASYGHSSREHAARANTYGTHGERVEVWVYGLAPRLPIGGVGESK